MARRSSKNGLLTQQDYAKYKGVSRQYINSLIKDGTISTGADGLIDPALADLELAAIADQVKRAKKQATRKPADDLTPGLDDLDSKELSEQLLKARIKRETEQAEKLRMERLQLQGRLIEKDLVANAVRNRALEEQNSLLGFPSKNAPEIAAQLGVSRHALQRLLDAAIRKHLRSRSQFGLDDFQLESNDSDDAQ